MIRYWTQDDKSALLPMIRDCLAINYGAGADMLPTEKNAEALFNVGIYGAERKHPCLVIVNSDGAIQGYTLWVELPNTLELDYGSRILHGLGTYIAEEFRRTGASNEIREVAEAIAKELGFDKIIGTAYHKAGLVSTLRRNFKISAMHVEKDLQC